uniref:Uncharacterized protein n=1 Tax=Arundo donax TaxID=35708 RepID=A0A0A8YSD6_ARUDO
MCLSLLHLGTAAEDARLNCFCISQKD